MRKALSTFVHNIKHNTEGMSSAKELANDLVEMVQRSTKTSRIGKVVNYAVNAYSCGILLHNAVTIGRDLFTENAPVFDIEINENDMLYNVVHGLINTTQKEEYQPTIELRSRAIDRYSDSKRELNIYKNHLVGGDLLRFEGEKAFVYAVPGAQGEKDLEIAGHRVKIVIKKPDKAFLLGGYKDDPTGATSVRGSRGGSTAKKYTQTTAIIKCESEKAREEVKLYLRNNLSIVGKRRVGLYIGQNYGSFSGTGDIPERDISTVILKDNQLDHIIKELATFIDSEAKYTTLGVPYHHGILLSGPPGTGKSSTAKAVAAHLGLDTYYIPLSSIRDNETFNELISEIKPRSILLLEDIDTIRATKERTKKGKEGITMDALLNVLDGVLSPHGVITIATTNHIEVFDNAMIRPGRIDTVYSVDYLDNGQLERLCSKFIVDEPFIFPDITGLKISPADIIGEIKKHIDEPEAAIASINTFLTERIEKKARKAKEKQDGSEGNSSEVSEQLQSAVHAARSQTSTS